jgi:hypothetical protein
MTRFEEAKAHVKHHHFDPILELMNAANQAVDNAERRAIQAEATLEAMRPHWAQGYTSDSMAAQAKTTALSEIWEFLNVKNQTAAMAKLRELRKLASS